MTDVVIHLVSTVNDHSTPHTFGEDYPQPHLGGFSGGDLDGLGGTAVLWDPTDNHSQQAGKDIFEYELSTDTMPSGSLTAIALEVQARYRIDDDAVDDAIARTGQSLDAHIPASGPPFYDPEIWVLYNGNPGSDYTYVINSADTFDPKGQVALQFWLDDSIFVGPVDVLVTDTSATWYSTALDLDDIPTDEWFDGSHTMWIRAEQPDYGTLAAIAEATIYEARIRLTFDEGNTAEAARSTIDSKRGGVVFVPAEPGDYIVDAVTVNDRDTLSEASTPISVTVT